MPPRGEGGWKQGPATGPAGASASWTHGLECSGLTYWLKMDTETESRYGVADPDQLAVYGLKVGV